MQFTFSLRVNVQMSGSTKTQSSPLTLTSRMEKTNYQDSYSKNRYKLSTFSKGVSGLGF